jgi:Mg/Co/Ni transporter MgtE
MSERPDPLLLQFARTRPDDLAGVLANTDLRGLAEMIADLPADLAASVATRLPSWQLTGLLGALEPEAIAGMLVSATSDDAVAIVSHLQESRYPAILGACPAAKRLSLRQLFDYPSHSLASMATTRFIRVAAKTTCGEFSRQLSYSGDTRQRPVLVVDPQGRYLGMLNLQAVFSVKNRAKTAAEVATHVEPLSGLTSAESALSSRLWTRYNELPVVDARHRLLGVASRAALQRVVGDESAAEFSTERLFSELASGYLNTCGRLLEALLGRTR